MKEKLFEKLFPEKVKRVRLFGIRIFNIGGRMKKTTNSGGNK